MKSDDEIDVTFEGSRIKNIMEESSNHSKAISLSLLRVRDTVMNMMDFYLCFLLFFSEYGDIFSDSEMES